MAEHNNLKSLFSDIADSIRAKTGSTDTIVADNFPEEIAAIETCPEDALFLKSSTIPIAMPSYGQWKSIAYGNGVYVAIAYDSNKASYSNDGINWFDATMPVSCTWISVVYADDKFLAISNTGGYAAQSIDGITWTSLNLPSSVNWSSVAYGNGNIVILPDKNSNDSLYSSDGVNWSVSRVGYKTNWWVAYGNDKFVALSQNSGISLISTDGSTWTTHMLSDAMKSASMVYGNGKFVAISDSLRSIFYSEDGVSWTKLDAMPSYGWGCMAYGDGKFVAIKENSTDAAYSIDGINWTGTTIPTASNWSSIVYGDGKFVAVSDGGSANGSNMIMYSVDGINWISDVAINCIVDVNDTDVTEETVQATGLLDPELADQDAKIAELQELLQGKAVPAPEDLTEELATQSEIIAEQDELITQLASALEGKVGASGGAEVLSGTVTPTDEYNITISDAIGKDNVVLMASPSDFSVGAIKKDYICSFTCQNDYMSVVIAGGSTLAFYDVNDFFDLFIFDKTTGTVSLNQNAVIYERFCQDTYQYFTW